MTRALGLITGLILIVPLAGCSTGVWVGSASYQGGPEGGTYCSRSYSGQVGVPGDGRNGLHKSKGCVTTVPEDTDD